MDDDIQDEGELNDADIEEGYAVEYWSRFDRRDEPDWFVDMQDEAPVLNIDFIAAANGHSVNFTRDGFDKRFSWVSKRLDIPLLSTENTDELFSLAAEQRQQLAAYGALQLATNGQEFVKLIEFLSWKRKRMDAILGLLKDDKPLVPQRVSLWESFWAERLERVARANLAQTKIALEQMTEDYRLAHKFGRTNLESHLLYLALSHIQAMPKGNRKRSSSLALLVAYGHASQLEVLNDSEKGGDPIEAMKVRMSRMRHADKTKRTKILGLFLAQMIKESE
jgi:hypothetical protein